MARAAGLWRRGLQRHERPVRREERARERETLRVGPKAVTELPCGLHSRGVNPVSDRPAACLGSRGAALRPTHSRTPGARPLQPSRYAHRGRPGRRNRKSTLRLAGKESLSAPARGPADAREQSICSSFRDSMTTACGTRAARTPCDQMPEAQVFRRASNQVTWVWRARYRTQPRTPPPQKQ
jgi:hypothetical protein